MSTALAPKNGNAPAAAKDDRVIEYVPFGESKPIKLTLGMVRSHIALPTKSGQVPADSELIKFMMLCQSRELNPWVGDAFLVGYDSQDGPKFSLITAIQALLKRAEANPNFDGMESGVVVTNKDGQLIERQGDLVLPGETLLGSWARLWRKDRAHSFYDSLKFSTYDTGRSQWKKDPAGMIVKVAEASVLRKAFPSQLGALYIEQERGALERGDAEYIAPSKARVTTIPGLTSEPPKQQEQPPEQRDEADQQTSGPAEAEQSQEQPGLTEAELTQRDVDDQDRLDALQEEFEAASKVDMTAINTIRTREIQSRRWTQAQLGRIDAWADAAMAIVKKSRGGSKQKELAT